MLHTFRSILVVGLSFLIAGCPQVQQDFEQVRAVVGNAYRLKTLYCGPEDGNPNRGLSWKQLKAFAEKAGAAVEQELDRSLAEVERSKDALLAERKAWYQKVRDLHPEIQDCALRNITHFTSQEADLVSVLMSPRTLHFHGEGLEQTAAKFVRSEVVPLIERTGARVLVLGEYHNSKIDRALQEVILSELAKYVSTQWVAHELLKTHPSYADRSGNLIRDYDLSREEFEEKLKENFPKDDGGSVAEQSFQIGLRKLFLRMHDLRRSSGGHALVRLDERYTGLYTLFGDENLKRKAWDLEVLDPHVSGLREGELGVIISGASHCAQDPDSIGDYADFKNRFGGEALNLIPIRNVSYSEVRPSLSYNDGYMPIYLSRLDWERLKQDPGLFPLDRVASLSDLRRGFHKVTMALHTLAFHREGRLLEFVGVNRDQLQALKGVRPSTTRTIYSLVPSSALTPGLSAQALGRADFFLVQ